MFPESYLQQFHQKPVEMVYYHCSESNGLSNWLSFFAILVAVLIFIFEQILKHCREKKIKRQNKKDLKREMEILYRTVCQDILKYKRIKESGKLTEYTFSVYFFPTLEYILKNNNISEYFNEGEEYSIGLNICQLLPWLNNPPLQQNLDWFFKKRLIPLRQNLLDLVRLGKVTDNLNNAQIHSEVSLFLKSIESDQ
jgi:hypothetical protein